MVATVGVAQIICNRFTELDFPIWYWRAPTAKDLLWIEESDILTVPCDSAIDAMNVFELLTGINGIPSEKIQRVGILSLREDRLSRRLRCILHIQTRLCLRILSQRL